MRRMNRIGRMKRMKMKSIWKKVPSPMIVWGFESETPVRGPVNVALLTAVPRVLLPRTGSRSGGLSDTTPAGVIMSARGPLDMRIGGNHLVMRKGVHGIRFANDITINAEIPVF